MLKKLSIGLALIAIGFLAGSLLIGSIGTAEPGWVMGDLTQVACRVDVQQASGQYVVADILTKIADRAGIPLCVELPLPCEACVAKLNKATLQDFLAIPGIGETLGPRLVAAQPFVVSPCIGAASIESVVDQVKGIGEVHRADIVRWFCPELY